MVDVVAGPVLAVELGNGAGGLLVVVLLGALAIGLFVAMSGSLRRMRANVARGEFGVRRSPSDPASPASPPDPAAERDSGLGSGRAGADPTIPPQR